MPSSDVSISVDEELLQALERTTGVPVPKLRTYLRLALESWRLERQDLKDEAKRELREELVPWLKEQKREVEERVTSLERVALTPAELAFIKEVFRLAEERRHKFQEDHQ